MSFLGGFISEPSEKTVPSAKSTHSHSLVPLRNTSGWANTQEEKEPEILSFRSLTEWLVFAVPPGIWGV
ncbi:MAG: hypothetical protein EA399_17085 [Desulfovibrionales bacterium]|nr:MAG: hypothetical protein EA399_17085 [Desulfovibrionales bacterium]